MWGRRRFPSVVRGASISSEALIKGYDEKGLKVTVGTSAEILTLPANLDVKNGLRESVLLELFYFVVPELETVSAVNRHKFTSIPAKV
jgi:hypothetical protein